MQSRVLQMARLSHGPETLCNTIDGKPDRSRSGRLNQPGQLVYYFQAVDRFVHQQPRERYMSALRFLNLSKSSGLHGVLGIFVGMRVRLTKKICEPELVQEATGEVIDIAFHPEERFGDPASSNIRPGDFHGCWQRPSNVR